MKNMLLAILFHDSFITLFIFNNFKYINLHRDLHNQNHHQNLVHNESVARFLVQSFCKMKIKRNSDEILLFPNRISWNAYLSYGSFNDFLASDDSSLMFILNVAKLSGSTGFSSDVFFTSPGRFSFTKISKLFTWYWYVWNWISKLLKTKNVIKNQ